MNIDKFGLVSYTAADLIELLYQEKHIAELLIDPSDPEIEIYQRHQLDLGLEKLQIYHEPAVSVKEFDAILQSNWYMPDEYKNMDIESFLIAHSHKQNHQRLIEELQKFREMNMLNLLRWLKYFVDVCRSNNIIWGVGRGSSVASYALFVIGVHKIDPIKYNLDWREFLR